MDNRLRFLYLSKTELWGRRVKMRAGNGETGRSAEGGSRENRCRILKREGSEIKVEKRKDTLPRKAAIVFTKPVP